MNEILVGQVKIGSKSLYTEEIINLLTIGNSSRHQMFVGEISGGPAVFRKTAEIYSVQFHDTSWKINKKPSSPNKLYVIDDSTVLQTGEINVTFKRIKENQLEVIKDTTPMTRRKNISDLLSAVSYTHLTLPTTPYV